MAGHPARRGHDGLSADLYKVGNFTIGRVLGVGSFGKVKLATLDRRCGGGDYAVKIIEKEKFPGTGLSSQIRTEVLVMQALHSHPNLVHLHSVESTSDKVYIFMEYVEGGELFDEIVRNTYLPELLSRFYFTQLIVGLAACHDRSIYHRDLKPENLLIDASGLLKICDFGLSSIKNQHPSTSTSLAAASFRQRELERDAGGPARTPMTSLSHSTGRTLLHTQCGTPNYVAPEIISLGADKKGYSGDKVDVWGCGVILYILVAGALPFDSDDTEELFRMILSGETKFPKHFSQPLVDLCSNLLQTDPKARFCMKQIAESRWMTMPAEELAKLCNEDVSLAPNYPDKYIVSFPWEKGGDGSISSLRLGNVPVNLDIGVGTTDLFASPVVDLDPTAKVPSAASFGVGVGYGEGVRVYDALSHEAASLERMLPPAVGIGVTQGGHEMRQRDGNSEHGDVHDFVSVSFQEGMVSPNLEGAGNLARTAGSGRGSPQPASQQSSVYSSSSPPGGTDGASANVLGDQLRHLPATYTPQSHSQDSSMGAMAQIQNEISAMKSASIYDRSSGSDGASAQGRTSSVVAAAAAAAAAVLPQGSRDQIAVVAAAAASAALNAVARSSAGSFQARSGSSLEDTNEMWRRKVEIDASGATRPVYLVDSAEIDGKSHQAILNAKRAAMDMAKAANVFASANSVAERAMFRAAAAANAAVSVFGGRVAEHPQHGQVQPYSHAQQQQQQQDQPYQVTAPSQHVQFQVEPSQFRPASSGAAGQNPHLTRRLSRSGASFRSSPMPVMVDGSLVGARTTSNSGSPVLSPIGQSPLTSMASNGVDAVAGRRVPAVSSAGKTGTTHTAPASTSAGLPVHSQARSQAGDQRHCREIVAQHRHLVKQLQEVQHDQLGQLKQSHARQLQLVNQAMQSEVGPQQAGVVSARPHSSRDTKGADRGAHSPNPLASKERQNAIMASPSGASQSGLPGTGGEDRVSVGDTRKNTGERSPNPKSVSAAASLASPGPSTRADEKSVPSPATPPATYVPSAIVRDGDSGKQENMFDMNIPGPAFGPPPPPKQSKLAVAIQAKTGFGKKKQRRPGSEATRSVSQQDGSKSCGVSVAKIAGSILPGASTAQYTQFHSLNPPRKCCELVEGSLKSYGCSQVSGKASGPESYKIKCVKVVERQPIVVSIDIYQADGDLSTISFKRKGNVDARRFCQLFDDVHRLFSQKCAQLEPAEEDECGAVLSGVEEDGVGSSPITRTGMSNLTD